MWLDGALYMGFMMTFMIGMLLISYALYSAFEALKALIKNKKLDIQKLSFYKFVVRVINGLDRLVCSTDDAIVSRAKRRRGSMDVDGYIVKMLRNDS